MAQVARWVALGDPQAPAERFLSVLHHRGLLTRADSLADGAALLSIGDHFDFMGADPATDWAAGLSVLSWLTDQDPSRTTLLLGNHDTARVQELAAQTEASFAAARELAAAAYAPDAPAAAVEEYHRRWPDLPAPGVIARDYSTFRPAQRDLVVRLLLGRRFRLAAVGRLPDGRPVLLTHAGVTERELRLLGLDGCRDAELIAAALNRFLDERLAQVRPAWERAGVGAPVPPLDLAPLHLPGPPRREGGGLLYHRPANPDPAVRPAADLAWEFDAARPRRFDPRALPVGLVQACGHVRHPTSLRELRPWPEPAAAQAPAGRLRTLVVRGDSVTYAARRLEPATDAACLYLIDGEMARTPPADYEVLELAGLSVP